LVAIKTKPANKIDIFSRILPLESQIKV